MKKTLNVHGRERAITDRKKKKLYSSENSAWWENNLPKKAEDKKIIFVGRQYQLGHNLQNKLENS